LGRLLGVAGMALAALAWVPAALAQSPAVSGYGGVGGEVQGDVGGGSLPFTGLDLGLLVLGGLLLVAAGLSLRRLAKNKS
jgi:hypothetical protein